jgi:uncharacterized protein (TIGR03435 family)
MQSTLNQPEAQVWPQIAPLLDDALDRLDGRDRDAIVLRFFENKSLREVGHALGASEDAAKMRVNRALERLRKIFSKRGVTLTTALIAGAISAHSAQAAPAGLALTISAVAFTKGAAAGGSTLTLAKGALKIMAWTKMKTAIVVGAGLLLATGTTTMAVRQIQHAGYDDSQWDTGRIDSRILETAPHIVRIIPAKLSKPSGWAGNGEGRIVGLGEKAKALVQAAYDASGDTRTIFLAALPEQKYDFIANLPSGSGQALRREVAKKFGVVGRFETAETNVLFLRITSHNAPGLKPTTTKNMSSSQYYPEGIKLVNMSAASIANCAEGEFRIPVIDQTGLEGGYDINLKWNNRSDPQHEKFKLALQEQLGLELVPGTAPVKMLFVDKAR